MKKLYLFFAFAFCASYGLHGSENGDSNIKFCDAGASVFASFKEKEENKLHANLELCKSFVEDITAACQIDSGSEHSHDEHHTIESDIEEIHAQLVLVNNFLTNQDNQTLASFMSQLTDFKKTIDKNQVFQQTNHTLLTQQNNLLKVITGGILVTVCALTYLIWQNAAVAHKKVVVQSYKNNEVQSPAGVQSDDEGALVATA